MREDDYYYLYCENSFCASFDPNELNRLYQRWCDQNNEEYGAAKVNIYALTYTNALLCDYLKRNTVLLPLHMKTVTLFVV